MLEVYIGPAQVEDLESLISVVEEIFPQDFDFGGFSYHKCKELFTHALQDVNEYVYVAKEGPEGAMMGFVYFINKPPTNGTAIAEMGGVKGEYQNRGVGAKLLSGAIEQYAHHLELQGIKNLATIHFTTGKDNVVAQKLFSACGFQAVAEIPGLVGEGNTELFMMRKVKETPYRTGLWQKEEKKEDKE